ncbi:CLUMA_CG020185, isoform A [Clunio marinus]|uniref:CLUMA_CG020185, isoform A n=1 Tax=Clunio marinus TaxID=568069 RepID=A0A1J1J5G9_9DIPT|nr:CLUMA_CG020185, isoform A [Clunio marinus]
MNLFKNKYKNEIAKVAGFYGCGVLLLVPKQNHIRKTTSTPDLLDCTVGYLIDGGFTQVNSSSKKIFDIRNH